MIETLLGVVVGFVLAIVWDIWKSYRETVAETKRAIRVITQEIGNNLHVLATNVALLKQDIAVADKGQEVVQALNFLSLAAGETEFLRGSLERKSRELAERVGNLYATAKRINDQIQARESYRITNGAMSNFAGRRKLINSMLIPVLEQHIEAFNDLLRSLAA